MPRKRRKPKPPPEVKPVPAAPRILAGDDALAKHYDVTTKSIYDWRRDGMPAIRDGRGFKYDLDQTDPWVQAKRGAGGNTEEVAALQLELKRAKLRAEIAEANRLEREEAQAIGNILPLDEYKLFAIEQIQAARDSFLSVPKQMRPHLCKKCQDKLSELQSLIDKTLRQLGKLPDGPPKE